MPNKSSNSVSVTWLDRNSVLERLKGAVRALAAGRPEVERVLLFGSLTRGNAVPGSDADLLVILSASDRPFRERIPLYIPAGAGIGTDVFPYTASEIDRLLNEGSTFLREALSQAVEIFARKQSPM